MMHDTVDPAPPWCPRRWSRAPCTRPPTSLDGMPETAGPLRSNGDPLVSTPARGAGGAHALRPPATPPVEEPADVNGDGLLTSNRVLVTAPRHRIEKRTPFLFII